MSNDKICGTAIVPGSFDPITLGHVDIIRRAAERYEHVVVAIMINPQKQYMFTMEQRKRIAVAALSDMDGVSVIASDGMLWKLAFDLGACAIVKGYRNEKDLAYENEMAEFNLAHNPNAPTVLLKASESMEDISSTRVRERILCRDRLDAFLPPSAINEINKILPRSI